MRANPRTSFDVEQLLRQHRVPLSLACLAALGFGIVSSLDTVGHVERHEEILIHGAWRETGTFAYTVPITNGSAVYGERTELGMGEPGYFTTLSPRVNIAFTWAHDDTRVEDVTAHVVLVAIAAPEGRSWSVREELGSSSALLAAGEPIQVHGVLDIPAMEESLQEGARERAQKPVAAQWRVVAEVTYARSGASPVVNVFTLPMEYDAPLYRLPDADAAKRVHAHGEREVVVHETRAGWAALWANPVGPGLVAAGGSGLVALWREPRRFAG